MKGFKNGVNKACALYYSLSEKSTRKIMKNGRKCMQVHFPNWRKCSKLKTKKSRESSKES